MKHYAYYINEGEIVYTSLKQEELERISNVFAAEQIMPRHYKIVLFFARPYKEIRDEIDRKVAEMNGESRPEVIFEYDNERGFTVFTDALSAEELAEIDGVRSVFQYHRDEYGVMVDHYDLVQDVQDAIRRKTKNRSCLKEKEKISVWTHEDELQRRIDAAHKLLDKAGISAGCQNIAERVERLVKKVARENRRANRLEKVVQNTHAEMTKAGFFGHNLNLVERVKQLLKRHNEMDDELKESDQRCYALCIDKIEKRFYDLLIKVAEELVG